MPQDIRVITSGGSINVSFSEDYHTDAATQSFQIQENGALIASEKRTTQTSPNFHPNSAKIYKYYCTAHENHFVQRSGFGACGIYRNYSPNSPPDYRKPESDSEHAFGCITLLEGLHEFYPSLLSPEGYERADRLLRKHDLGENLTGDYMDDGSQDTVSKNRNELISFVSAIADFSPASRKTLIQDFIYFQNPLDPCIPPNIAQHVQLARNIDKFEAILSALIYESHGAKGTLDYKNTHFDLLTERDRQSIIETGGDSSIIATWLVPVTTYYHACYGFPYLLDILRVAVIDLRGAWFPWFDDFCTRYHIPPEHLQHPALSSPQLALHEFLSQSAP